MQHVMDWAAHMEEIEDKDDTTFLTLAGQQSRETTPSRHEDTPTRKEATPSHHEDEPTRKEAMPSHREATPTRRDAPPTQREGTPTRREAVTTQREATTIQWESRREATPTYSEATLSQGRTSSHEESRSVIFSLSLPFFFPPSFSPPPTSSLSPFLPLSLVHE